MKLNNLHDVKRDHIRKLKRQEDKMIGEDLMTSKKKHRDYAKKHRTATSQTCSKMITPTILNDFGASLRAKEQRVQEWRLYGKKEYFAATVTPKQTF
jgi:hypothetical protein